MQIRTVLGMSLAILLLNLLIYRPVRCALRPADQILAVLGRMEAGDLSARMPRPRLIGFASHRRRLLTIWPGFQKTLAAQRQPAQRLLAVREEERRRLARGFAHEFGQCLASVRPRRPSSPRGRNRPTPLLPAARAVSAVTGQNMMESLRGILHRCSRWGLEGVRPRCRAWSRLVAGWRRRQPGCDFCAGGGGRDRRAARRPDREPVPHRAESLTNACATARRAGWR